MKRKNLGRAVTSALESFAALEDPRLERTRLHPLMNVVVMALCSVIGGANGWEEVAFFAKERLDWFGTFLDCRNGAPSADTFRRVFEALEPRKFEAAFREWLLAIAGPMVDEVIAVDGKSLRGAIQRGGSTTPFHLLHAWAAKQQLLLGQEIAERGAAGEIAAIPELLSRLSIEGAVVTADANACTASVTEAVRAANADYVIAVKGNRALLHAVVVDAFAHAEKQGFRGVPKCESENTGHGRFERRVVRAISLRGWGASDKYVGLKTAVMIERTRNEAVERHYFVSSLDRDVEKLAECIRLHWSVENNLHWMLDVHFNEDSRKIRDANANANFALLARIALMMLKRSPEKLSVKLKRKKAWMNTSFLASTLIGGITEV